VSVTCIMCGDIQPEVVSPVWAGDSGYAVFLCADCHEKARSAAAIDVLRAFDSSLPVSLNYEENYRSEGSGVPGTPVEAQAPSSVDAPTCDPWRPGKPVSRCPT
jgi:hypothetical protein